MSRCPSIRLGFALTLIASALSCSDQGPIDERLPQLDELERNEAIWSSVRPTGYRFAIERLCFCAADARGPVRLEVDGTTVVSRSYVESGEPVLGDARSWFPDVDGLFDVLATALGEGAHRVDVTYDPATGVPIDFWIDYDESVADEELGFRVTEGVAPTG